MVNLSNSCSVHDVFNKKKLPLKKKSDQCTSFLNKLQDYYEDFSSNISTGIISSFLQKLHIN